MISGMIEPGVVLFHEGRTFLTVEEEVRGCCKGCALHNKVTCLDKRIPDCGGVIYKNKTNIIKRAWLWLSANWL